MTRKEAEKSIILALKDMLRGIYASYPDKVTYAAGDLRCYCVANKKPGKVAIITGGGTGHLPLFLGYVGDGLLDGCGVGGVFQSPSAEQIYTISKQVEAGAGILYLYGNYTGDIMVIRLGKENLIDETLRTGIHIIKGLSSLGRLVALGMHFVVVHGIAQPPPRS